MSVTSRQIMDALSIENAKTLKRWEDAGVMPKKAMQLHPNGIGRIAVYPDWVLQHCRRVQQLVQDGFTLKRVAEQLGGDWETIRLRYQKYDFADDSMRQEQVKPIQEIIEDVIHEVARLVLVLTGDKKGPPTEIVTYESIIEAIELVHASFNPLLVVDNGHTFVVADFAISAILAKRGRNAPPVAILPLWQHLSCHLPSDTFPKRPAAKPLQVFVDADGVHRRFRVSKQNRIKITK